MPELPEVETIVRTLEKSLLNETVNHVELMYEPLLETDSMYPMEILEGKKFVGFHRRGKYLCFEFSDGYYWIIHLRMEGKFHLYGTHHRLTKHTHLLMQTEHHEIHYLDTRKFSRMAVTKDPDSYFMRKKLGFEPWDTHLTSSYLYEAIHKSTRAIKLILLDQSIITGIGNIYADEILFDTQIHPLTKGNKITKKQCELIINSTRNTLENAIAAGGTTIRSYTSALNVTGRFQITLKAYGQEGEPCSRCETPMVRIVVGGRSTVFCPKCQKVKR
ncbi:bifunctional DNA-formamidopyrimidine glycosylase/DNA-(apurinic or apyrimidinic site) lyase [Erysipelothrix inopinata]|uniref:Formamidopyrimidine-DNA glycosylase n=1 Tax=Erysipelothrix inopinata TaxID=225084 RepID=A0A7G9RY05_9FIRM|nr:bifunctional DNA-formamidopyrimidine glycosylase/DNA-(apurinic or apyrimidinic site) lyase [Erysipelothrix inopinata]QNN60480.1 bifunctional DNA-formamidopyrimidine glycosylase/DNA-(apurinic or apyrimidinic site) lyase [Erysipelothrix inopinata]